MVSLLGARVASDVGIYPRRCHRFVERELSRRNQAQEDFGRYRLGHRGESVERTARRRHSRGLLAVRSFEHHAPAVDERQADGCHAVVGEQRRDAGVESRGDGGNGGCWLLRRRSIGAPAGPDHREGKQCESNHGAKRVRMRMRSLRGHPTPGDEGGRGARCGDCRARRVGGDRTKGEPASAEQRASEMSPATRWFAGAARDERGRSCWQSPSRRALATDRFRVGQGRWIRCSFVVMYSSVGRPRSTTASPCDLPLRSGAHR